MAKKIVAGSVLILLLGFAMYQAMADKKEEGTGGSAPEIALKDLNGEEVRLSDFKEKKVVVNFWATWCKPCREEMPAMEKYHQNAGDDVVFLAVNTDPLNDVKGFVDEMDLTFPILLDEKDKTSKDYSIVSIPTTFFIDENGVVAKKHIGQLNYEEISNMVNDM